MSQALKIGDRVHRRLIERPLTAHHDNVAQRLVHREGDEEAECRSLMTYCELFGWDGQSANTSAVDFG